MSRGVATTDEENTIAAVYVLSVTLSFSQFHHRLITNLMYDQIPLVAAIACFYAYTRVRKSDKAVLFFLGLGTLAFAFGEIAWGYYEVVLGLDEPPYPSVADYFYLASYPLYFISFLSMSRFSGAGALTRIRAILDIVVVTVLAFVPMWFFLIKPVYTPEAPLSEAIVNGLYPALDIALIVAILINFDIGSPVQRRPTTRQSR